MLTIKSQICETNESHGTETKEAELDITDHRLSATRGSEHTTSIKCLETSDE